MSRLPSSAMHLQIADEDRRLRRLRDEWWAPAFLAAFVAALNIFLLRDSDTWWHLKTGELIWAQRAVLRVDPFSYTIAGRPWVDFEWLSQLLFHGLWRSGGPTALILFKALVAAAAFLLLWGLAPAAAPAVRLAVFGLAALGMRGSFVERPFIFDFLLLAILARALERAGFDAPQPRLRWSLAALGVLWANLHGGAAILLPVLVGAAAAAQWLADRKVPARWWAETAGICAVALLATPNGWLLLPHLWRTLSFPGKERLYEWHGLWWAYDSLGLYLAFLAAGIAACVALFRERPWACAWFLGTALASGLAVRHAALFFLCAAPLAAQALGRLASRLRPGGLGAPASIAAALSLSLAAWVHTDRFHAHLAPRFGLGTEEPLGPALEFIEREGIRGRLFNEYESGGYVIWKSYPRLRVFVDGRNVEYGPEHIHAALSWHHPEVWRSLVERWDFDVALIRIQPGAYTARVLDDDPRRWRLVYWDDNAMVYLRERRAHARVLKRHGLRLLRPAYTNYQYLEPVLRDRRLTEQLLGELDKSLEAAPRCANALLLKANVLLATGSRSEALSLAQRAVSLYPRKAQPRFTLGWTQAADGDLASAEASYRRALALVRSTERAGVGADILNNLGVLQERRGEDGAARRAYARAVDWNPGQLDARRNLERLQR